MSDNHNIYQSPLALRNAGPEMLKLFSPQHKFSLWRKLWLELAKCERELGLDRITPQALEQMEKHLDDIDFAKAADWEKRLRHDVMAHIKTFEEAAPAAKGIIHLGATSMYVVDNADLLILRDALTWTAGWLANIVDALGSFAAQWKTLPTLGYTHFQPAQLTTVGKRAALWAQDFALDLEEIEHRLATLRCLGCKGATGTQASFLALFNGDSAKVEALDKLIAKRLGFPEHFAVAGQTYPRKLDAHVCSSLAAIASGVHKFSNDVRLLAGLKQIEEPFEEEQVGSSAMPYKRNPMLCERATGLARFVISIQSSALQTAAEQWLERTLDDSSNKRLTIPESFLAIDGCLRCVAAVARGMVVYPKTIQAAVNAELPFMATEEILMAAVAAGASRQEAHETIRRHSLAAGEQVKMHGHKNDLLERLASEKSLANVDFNRVTNPAAFTGRSAEQVDHFLHTIVEPIRKRYSSSLGRPVEMKV
jgi:adenylosuccinate lyase